MTSRPVDSERNRVRPPLGESFHATARQLTVTGWLALTAGLVAAIWIAVRSGPAVVVATYAVASASMLVAAAIDSVERRLPDVLTIGGSLAALAGAGGAALLGEADGWCRAVVGGAIFAGWILTATLLVPGGYGLGDVKLAALCGALLAWHSWPVLAAGMVATQVAIAATLLVARHRRKTRAPLGPVFAAATLMALVVAVT